MKIIKVNNATGEMNEAGVKEFAEKFEMRGIINYLKDEISSIEIIGVEDFERIIKVVYSNGLVLTVKLCGSCEFIDGDEMYLINIGDDEIAFEDYSIASKAQILDARIESTNTMCTYREGKWYTPTGDCVYDADQDCWWNEYIDETGEIRFLG